MESSDLIGVYGAALATCLAFLQLHQWKKSSEVIAVRVYDEFYQKWTTDIELSITNVTDKVIEIHVVWFGAGYRPWLTPWRRKHFGAIGVQSVTDEGVGNQLYLKKVEPGNLISAYVFLKDVQSSRDDYRVKFGFDCQPCIWVEHSLSKKEICKVIDG